MKEENQMRRVPRPGQSCMAYGSPEKRSNASVWARAQSAGRGAAGCPQESRRQRVPWEDRRVLVDGGGRCSVECPSVDIWGTNHSWTNMRHLQRTPDRQVARTLWGGKGLCKCQRRKNWKDLSLCANVTTCGNSKLESLGDIQVRAVFLRVEQRFSNGLWWRIAVSPLP